MTFVANTAAVLAAVTELCALFFREQHLLHMLQLEEYDERRFLSWMRGHLAWLVGNRWIDLLAVEGFLVLLISSASPVPRAVLSFTALFISSLAIAAEQRAARHTQVKKPLVMTPRARRLITGIMILAGCGIAAQLLWPSRALTGLALVIPWCAPLFLLVGAVCLRPVEASIRHWYIRDARSVLKRYSPIVIGITGSYGKTSTKFFTAHLLGVRYRTLMTPESYNTAMGICRVIRGELGPEHEVFVVELAENEKGGFRRLLGLVPCRISAVTSVGLQHLEEFGSSDVIQRTFREFITMAGSGETVVLNADDAVLGEIGDVSSKHLIRVGCTQRPGEALWAENVQMGVDGLSFDIVTATGERLPCSTQILGRHNVQNILLAVAIARELQVSWTDIQSRIGTLQAPPHRLQLMTGAGGVRIIDDAFNSNPAGFAMAMSVLASFPARRILITPGLVSLGSAEDAENEKAGTRAAAAADIVVLVGPQKTAPIRRGLLAAGFLPENIMTVHALNEVTMLMKTLVKPGDTVLFENDLPDTYNE